MVITVAEAVVDFMRQQAECVFGIPGGYLNGFVHAVKLAELRAIVPRHETSAVVMAAGYSQAAVRPGFAFAVPGGVTNTITGLAAADMDNVPLFLLVAQCPSNHLARDAHQETAGFVRGHDQIDILRPVTAFAARSPTADAAMRIVHAAGRQMMELRRPVAVEIGADYLMQEIEFERRTMPAALVQPARIDERGLALLCERLQRAKAPLLVLGNRVAKRGLSEQLRQLCETAVLPFAAVDFVKGIIPENHPLSLGVLGQCGHASATEYARRSDLVVTLGVRLSLQTTFVWSRDLFPNMFQVDDDYVDIDREVPAKEAAVGDLPQMVRALCAAAAEIRGQRDRAASERIVAELRAEHRVYASATSGLRSPSVLAALREVTPDDTYIVGDVGLTAQFLKQYFPVYATDGFFNLYGLASMGCGMPLALGVQAAAPGRRVLNVIGDGGMLQYLGELATQVEHKLPVVHVVLNNGGYKQIGDRLEWFFGHRAMCDFEHDLSRVGAAFGLHGERVTNPADLGPAMMRAFEAPLGAVIDVAVSGDNLSDVTPTSVREFQRKLFGASPTKWRL